MIVKRLAAQSNWLRPLVLLRVARPEEALVELQRGMVLPESGRRNISRRVNLAERYASMNRPEMALKTLDRLEQSATPYGRMAWHFAQLAAADELGDDSLAQEALDYLRAHEPDSPRILRNALVLSAMLDEAARVFVAE